MGAEERDFSTFNAMPADVFESGNVAGPDFSARMQVVRKSCVGCHRHGVSLQSFITFTGGFSPPGPELRPSFHDAKTPARGENACISNKQTRYDWGLLEGILGQPSLAP